MSTALEPAAPAGYGTLHGTLTVQLDGHDVQRVPVGGEPLGIGRLPANRVVLPHPSVSRHHAEVRSDGGRVVLVDVGSAGGTTVDGARLLPNQPVVLLDGVRIEIGPYVLGFVAAPPAAPPVVPARPSLPVPGVLAEIEPEPVAPPGRPTFPATGPAAGPSCYLQHLPALFHESEFLGRMLLIFEALWEPLEQRQAHLPLYVDAATAPAAMLPFLASWLDLELDPHWPETRRRRLLAEVMELYRWRGTTYGLGRMLEVCTGLPVRVSEDPAQPFVVRVAVTIPAGSPIRAEFLESLVRRHKPAHVGYVLEATR